MSSLSGTSLLSSILNAYGRTESTSGTSTTSTSSSDTSSGTTSTTSVPTKDTLDLQSSATLLSSLTSSASSSGSVSYPTNILQAAQNQVLLANNPDLAQTLAQQSSSPLLDSLSVPLQVLQTVESNSTDGVLQAVTTSLTSAASSMAQLQEVVNSGTLKTNSTIAQALLQTYAPGVATASTGSTVDTTA